MYLIFDTETSGFINKAQSLMHESQPVIMQIGMLMLDDKFEEIASYYSIVKPSRSYFLSDGAFAKHGISKERANQYGIPIDNVLEVWLQFTAKCKMRIAHNLAFDSTMINIEMLNYSGVEPTWDDDFCTMEASTPICKLPGKFLGKFKWPKLEEVYKFAFNESFDKAHDALADVRACAKVFKWLKIKQQPSLVLQ